MPQMIFVNMPVADVEKSAAFYEAIGFSKDARFSSPGVAAAMVWSDTIVFMILSHARFADFTSKRIVDAKSEVQTLLCLSIDSRDGWTGRDFNASASTVCSTAADYGPGGGCQPFEARAQELQLLRLVRDLRSAMGACGEGLDLAHLRAVSRSGAHAQLCLVPRRQQNRR